MGFAEDKVKEYIKRNMPMFYNLRLNQLLDFLPCLTDTDVQKIRRETDREGDNSSVYVFFNHLWCRRGWVTELIDALERNNSPLAEVIREVYRDAQLPSQRAQGARSPAVAQGMPAGPRASSLDDPSLPPPRNQPRSARDLLPECVNALTPAASVPLHDAVDCSAPVQETKCPSGSNEAASETEAKACGNDVKQKISTPDQHNRNAVESDSGLAAQHKNPADFQAASPRSPVPHQTPLRGMSEMEAKSSTPVSSISGAGNLLRNWDSFQPRPVCVKNGYFGNLSRSADSALSPATEPAVSSAPAASGNEPEEDSYVSSDSSSLAPREVNPVPLLQKDRQSQQANHRGVVFSEAIPFGSVPANLQRRGEAFPPSIPSETATANCFEQDSSSVCSGEVPQCCEATPCGSQFPESRRTISKGNTVDQETREPSQISSLDQTLSKSSQLPQRPLRKQRFGQIPDAAPLGQFSSPPSDFSGSSSTDVIPPSSPAAVSATPSDRYPEDLKSPVQERDPPRTDPWSTSEKVMGNVPSRATAAWPRYIPDAPANSRANRNNAGGPSRGAAIFHSSHEEEDPSLLKPGVLVSSDVPGQPLDQQLSNLGAEYSGTSDRLRLSTGSSYESDPLMLSDSTQGGCTEGSERSTSRGTTGTSLRRRNDDHSGGGSIRTHTGYIEEPPSVDLTGAPEITRPALGNASQPPGGFSDSEDQLTKNASSPAHNDGQRNSQRDKIASDAPSSHMSDVTLLAVGFTLTSLAAVAFVLYKQLKK